MRRREFITLSGGAAAAWPLVAHAQQAKIARVGFLGLVSASSHAARSAAFRTGLRELGWVEGKNIVIESRWAEGNYDRLPEMADELVRLKVDVLVTHGAAGSLPSVRRRRSRSSSPQLATWSLSVSRRACRGREATSPDYPFS
jgi:putative ABC transport system substrate-binding protein